TPRHAETPAARRHHPARCRAAAAGGGYEQPLALLAPDVRLVSDSGGKAKAPRRIIETADKVGRFLFAVAGSLGPDGEIRIMELNGGPAAVYFVGGKADTVFQIEVGQGVIQCAYIIRNPDKLSGLSAA
ncbi:RNA polymerase subunit sigma-24, partial [Streptomyces anulatus]